MKLSTPISLSLFTLIAAVVTGDVEDVQATSDLEARRTLPAGASSTVSIPSVGAIGFALVQTHSHPSRLTVSYDRRLKPHRHVNGTDVGLILHKRSSTSVYIINSNTFAVVYYLLVHFYPDYAPMPGGCNMELDVPVAPFIRLQTTPEVILDIGQASKNASSGCNLPPGVVFHEYYYAYSAQRRCSAEEYADGVRSMSGEGIRTRGIKVASIPGRPPLERNLGGVYPGIGVVYSAVVKNHISQAVYVPVYVCQELDRSQLLEFENIVLLCCCLCIGVLMNFKGGLVVAVGYDVNDDFRTLPLGFVTLIILAAGAANKWCRSFQCFMTVIVMLIIATGLEIISAKLIRFPLLPTAALAFLSFSILSVFVPDYILYDELAFVVLLLGWTVLCFAFKTGNAWASSVAGSFVVCGVLDVLVGSYLRFFAMNAAALVAQAPFGFRTVVPRPPYRIQEMALTCAWAALAVAGYAFQTGRALRVLRALRTGSTRYGTFNNN